MRYVLSILALVGAAACGASTRPIDTTPLPVNEPACADPYVQIVNHTSQPLEIYGYVGGTTVLLGEVSSTANRLTLMGTPLERQAGTMYAKTPGGQRVTQSPGLAKNSGSVQLTRKCGKTS
jgi:hypothetical protein